MGTNKTYTFFLITPKSGTIKEWAKDNCATYNFDYDNEKSGNVVVAWALSDSENAEKELSDLLTRDGITFSVLIVNDLDLFLGL